MYLKRKSHQVWRGQSLP